MRIVFLFIAIVVCVIAVIFSVVNMHDQDESYFKSLNLELTGVLKDDPDCPNGYNGFCVLSVDVLQSNLSEYDPRSKFPSYYCIIKDKQAEVYQLMASDCKKGDTVVISIKDKTFQSLRTKATHPILLNTNSSWYKYLSEYHQKL